MGRGNQSCVYFAWSVLFQSWVLFAWSENFASICVLVQGFGGSVNDGRGQLDCLKCF